jgi:hypothetical protein
MLKAAQGPSCHVTIHVTIIKILLIGGTSSVAAAPRFFCNVDRSAKFG